MTTERAFLEEPAATALAETFKVLGDVTRVRILDAISRSELCVNDIAGVIGLSESAVSHQLRLLRGMRLVRQRREGRMVFYALDDQHIVRLFEQGLEHVQERDAAHAAIATRERASAASASRASGGEAPRAAGMRAIVRDTQGRAEVPPGTRPTRADAALSHEVGPHTKRNARREK